MRRVALALLVLGLLVMLVAIAYGAALGGGFGDELAALFAYPWFHVTLVDLYVGFLLFAGWVWYRDPPAHALGWTLLLLVLGNVVACAYALVAFAESRGDMRRFWMGRRAEP